MGLARVRRARCLNPSYAPRVLGQQNQAAIERNVALVVDLLALPAECAWLEFKKDNAEPDRILRTASALANGARISDQPFGYMVWGVEDASHRVIGSTFEPTTTRKGNETLEFWLAKHLAPSPTLRFFEVHHPDGRILVLEVPAATHAPVKADGAAYIRIGDATPPLAGFPERERALWAKLQPFAWETGIAEQFVEADKVLQLLDYPSYFRLTNQPLPDGRMDILASLEGDRLIARDVGGRWNITNLGAALFASDLKSFDRLARKAVRVIEYDGKSRIQTKREQIWDDGYAVGFSELLKFISALLPSNEHIGQALRAESTVYPAIAIRELVANAIIHQDMTITGAGPMIEIFDDRIEITNPGQPLIRTERFIDAPPHSRNEALAALMRRMNICEERGSGIDKVIASVELYQLPPPDFQAVEQHTKAILYAPRDFAHMSAAERVRACYQHAVLRWVSGERTTNSSLRERFGIADHNASQVSRVIKAALTAGLIRFAEPDTQRAIYLPADRKLGLLADT